MKAYLLGFLVSGIAFAIATYFLPGLNYGGNTEILIQAALFFAILNIFVKPILDLLLLPLNYITLGLMRGLSGLIMIWLLTILVTGFSITDTVFRGANWGTFTIPAYELNALLTVIVAAFLIGFISSTILWLTR